MIRLAVSVEGQTEEEFVTHVLSAHLQECGVVVQPILLGRARGPRGGGNVTVDGLAAEMTHLLRSFDRVTSLVDFYGFRGRGDEVRRAVGTGDPGCDRKSDWLARR